MKGFWQRWKRRTRDKAVIKMGGGMPTTLDEAIEAVKRLLGEEQLEKVREGTLRASHMHFGIAMELRNVWKLWQGGPLAQWFNAHGIMHADDMTGIVFETLERRIKGLPDDVEGQIAHRREYWKAGGTDPDTLQPMVGGT